MKRGYSENENGDVVLTMTRDDFERVLMAVAFFTGAWNRESLDVLERAQALRDLFAFANRLNDGNPNWTPYQL